MIESLRYTVRGIYKILDHRNRVKALGIGFLIFISGIVDLLGLALFVPLINTINDPAFLEENESVQKFAAFFGLHESNQIVLSFLICVFAFFILRTIVIIGSNYIQTRFVYGLSLDLGIDAYNRFLGLGYERIAQIESMKVLRELTVNPQQFAKLLVLPILMLVNEFLVLAMIIGGIAYYNYEVLILLSVSIFPVAYLFNALIRKRMRVLGSRMHELHPILMTAAVRGVRGYVDARLRGKLSHLVDDYGRVFADMTAIGTKVSVLGIMPAKLFELTTIFGLLLIFIYGTFFADGTSEVIALVTIYAAAGYRIIPSLSKILPSLFNLEQYRHLIKLYQDILSSSESIPATGKKHQFKSEIQFEKVTFSYSKSDRLQFGELSLTIKKGEVVGVIGASGAGKTTFVNLLCGLLKPVRGHIKVDGETLNDGTIGSWMRTVSYVQQKPYIEKGSLLENVAFLDQEPNRQKVIESLRKARLKELAELDVSVFEVEEEGKNLSGGQQQRVVIARALYQDCDVIILDEATAALDHETERQINDSILDLKNNGITVIVIAHRYSTLRYADRILDFREGQLLQEIQYSDLISADDSLNER